MYWSMQLLNKLIGEVLGAPRRRFPPLFACAGSL